MRRNRIEHLATHEDVNLTCGQLADYWNVELQTVRKWIRRQWLPAFRVGRALRVSRVAAVAFEQTWRRNAADVSRGTLQSDTE